MMRWLIALLAVFFLALQYRLWIGEGSWAEVAALEREIDSQRAQNERLRGRNQVLAAEVRDLKQGLGAVEERARSELGMIKRGETFYLIVEE